MDRPVADELAAVELAAAELETGVTDAPGASLPAAPAPDTVAELLSALQLLRAMAAPVFGWWSEYRQVWSDGALQGIADTGAAVMQKHGWTLGEVWSEFGPYVALAGAVIPPSLATYQARAAHMNELRMRASEQRERPQPTAH